MQTYEITVRNRAVAGNSEDMSLVRTSVGIDQAHVLFDNEEWLDFPVTITFAQGEEMVTKPLVVSEVDSDGWVAEATCEIPWEVIGSTGPIRVTLQGTDSEGRHIITAKGAPLSVEEAGDVVLGDIPADAPSVDDWNQAMADAMAAVNSAASLVNTLQSKLDDMVAVALASVAGYELPVASQNTLGGVKVGENLEVDEDGTLSAKTSESSGGGLTSTQLALLYNLQLLAAYAFDSEFLDGVLQDSVVVKEKSLPLAKISKAGVVKVDNDTIKVALDGTISSPRYELPAATPDTLGGVRPDGTTVLVSDGLVSVPTADGGRLGLVRPDGTTITIDEHGVLTASGGGGDGYILPRASQTQLGGVMVDGETIGIVDGVISVLVKDASTEVY